MPVTNTGTSHISPDFEAPRAILITEIVIIAKSKTMTSFKKRISRQAFIYWLKAFSAVIFTG